MFVLSSVLTVDRGMTGMLMLLLKSVTKDYGFWWARIWLTWCMVLVREGKQRYCPRRRGKTQKRAAQVYPLGGIRC